MSGQGIFSDLRGAAAAEMALLLPLLILLLFGGLETAHFIWTQHKLTESVRNGARYASRLPIDEFCTDAGLVMSGATLARIQLVTRTGQLADSGADPQVPGWSNDEVSVQVECGAFVDTGIYHELGMAAPIVTVQAEDVSYPMLFSFLRPPDGNDPPDPQGGFSGIVMTAKSSAAVIGI